MPRSRSIPAQPAAIERSGHRDTAGRFAPKNTIGKGRGWKAAVGKLLGRAIEDPVTSAVGRNAWVTYNAILRELPRRRHDPRRGRRSDAGARAAGNSVRRVLRGTSMIPGPAGTSVRGQSLLATRPSSSRRKCGSWRTASSSSRPCPFVRPRRGHGERVPSIRREAQERGSSLHRARARGGRDASLRDVPREGEDGRAHDERANRRPHLRSARCRARVDRP